MMFADSEKLQLQNALKERDNDRNLSLVNENMSYQELSETKKQYEEILANYHKSQQEAADLKKRLDDNVNSVMPSLKQNLRDTRVQLGKSGSIIKQLKGEINNLKYQITELEHALSDAQWKLASLQQNEEKAQEKDSVIEKLTKELESTNVFFNYFIINSSIWKKNKRIIKR